MLDLSLDLIQLCGQLTLSVLDALVHLYVRRSSAVDRLLVGAAQGLFVIRPCGQERAERGVLVLIVFDLLNVSSFSRRSIILKASESAFD